MKEQIIKKSVIPQKTTIVNPKGTIIREKTYNAGKLDGPINLYWDNGNIRLTGQFKESIREGKWKHYNPEGDIILEENF